MKNNDEILISLARIEQKLDTHLDDHKHKFDLFTRVFIPSAIGLSSVLSSIMTHWFSGPKH